MITNSFRFLFEYFVFNNLDTTFLNKLKRKTNVESDNYCLIVDPNTYLINTYIFNDYYRSNIDYYDMRGFIRINIRLEKTIYVEYLSTKINNYNSFIRNKYPRFGTNHYNESLIYKNELFLNNLLDEIKYNYAN